jgi:predicted methyltransferase
MRLFDTAGAVEYLAGYERTHLPLNKFSGYERMRSAAQSGVSQCRSTEWTVVMLCKLFFLFVATAAWSVSSHAQSPEHMHHSFGGAEHWAKVFDDPQRDKWQKPHEVIAALKLAPDAAVADIGAGTGYFAVRFAHMLPKGRVYGVDLEPDMVKYLNERAKKENLANLTAVAAARDDARIPAPVDLVMLVDVYHHIDQRAEYFRKLRASLKPGGRIAIIDFRMDAPTGPPQNARIAPDRVKTEMQSAGYSLGEEHAFLPNQYFLIFKPAT